MFTPFRSIYIRTGIPRRQACCRLTALAILNETILAGDKLICYGNIESIAAGLIQL
ncbi:MAG: hypothetical protein V1794_06410 [Candidatus Glassbacteria bacterium]